MDIELLRLMRQTIKRGDLKAVKKLILENEGLLEIVTPLGSWLHMAAEYGNCELVEYFINCGLDVNLDGGLSEASAISCAAENGHLDVVKLLYQNGTQFDVSKATKNPLFGAIYGNHLDVVKFLVENGINIAAKYKIGKLEQCDAYEYARQLGRTQIANYLYQQLALRTLI